MTIQNTARTRRGLRHLAQVADTHISELEKDNAYKSQGLSKPELDEIKTARDWLKQEAEEPSKKGGDVKSKAA